MSDELREIFREEAEGLLHTLNDGLLQLDTSQGADLDTMRRAAHTLKGAARASGFSTVEEISAQMEIIFGTAMNGEPSLTPAVTDALYDGLDFIRREIDAEETELWVQEAIQDELRKLAEGVPDEHDQTSKEMVAIKSETMETPAASENLLNVFSNEASDYLTTLNNGLLQIEMSQAAPDPDAIRELFRIAHSMKGAARAVGWQAIERVSHEMESIFQGVLDRKQVISPDVADSLYDGLDVIRRMIDADPVDEETINEVIVQLGQWTDQPPLQLKPKTDTTLEIPRIAESDNKTKERTQPPTMLLRPPEDGVRVAVRKLDQLMADAGELLVAQLRSETQQDTFRELREMHMHWQRDWRRTSTAYLRLVRRLQESETEVPSELTTLLSFLDRNQQYLQRINRSFAQFEQTFAQDNMQLSLLAERMQEQVSNLRMMPLETISGSFQRMVRDMSRELGKRVHFEADGLGVEIDKTVLDALKDPLLHLIRNAVDHGLETPDERIAQGKDPVGYIWLTVEQRSSEITIEVRDDGRGLSLERIRQKAISRGMLSTQEARALSDDDTRMLVFQSGLSTSEEVTTLSGRGLGLDIVRTRVETLRGRVSITSEQSQGTTVTLYVPVSLTRLRTITLRVGESRYALPSVVVERMETLPRSAIFIAAGQQMIEINEQTMRLASLAEVLGEATIPPEETIHVVVLRVADRTVAFAIDELLSETELVLKPLGRELLGAPLVAGAGLLGTGEIVIVLDPNELVRQASGLAFAPSALATLDNIPQIESQQRVLVVDDSITTRTLEKNILEVAGYEVYIAVDGIQARNFLRENEVDVVVTDIEMPHMNGLQLTQLIRNSAHTQNLPVIVLTSLHKPEQREAGMNAGANHYLVKTEFEQGELLRVLQQLL